MITNEQAQRIASAVLSSPVSQMLTLVPHDEGRFDVEGQSFVWHSLHLVQAHIFLVVRRPIPKGPLEYVAFNSVMELAQASARLRDGGCPPLAWRPVN
ncbi:hypothetical protein IT407_03875 [Candidatus Uhrbacteria bacterium]|nr:hypothetical protein [Candidatus Uhrbacteria bacterium]